MANDLYRERFDPKQPLFEPVALDYRSRLAQRSCRRRWAAAVHQKRMKQMGFISLSASRKRHGLFG